MHSQMDLNSTQNWRMGFQEQRTNLTGVSKGQALSYKIIWKTRKRGQSWWGCIVIESWLGTLRRWWATDQPAKPVSSSNEIGRDDWQMGLGWRCLKCHCQPTDHWKESLFDMRPCELYGRCNMFDTLVQRGWVWLTVMDNLARTLWPFSLTWLHGINGKMCCRNLRCGWLWDLDPTKKKYKNRPTGSVALWIELIIMQMLVCREERKMYFSGCLCAEIGRGSKIQRGWWSLNGDAFSDSVAFLICIRPKVVGTLLTTKSKKDSHVMDQYV